MLLDANLLLYAVDEQASAHERARAWLEQQLRGDVRIALPWQTIGAFVRIATHPRIMRDPLSAAAAWEFVEDWLAVPLVWIPPTGPHTAALLGRLLQTSGAGGNLVPDAQLAALALEHGLTVMTADSDFARLAPVRWHNPLTGGAL